MKVRPVGPHEYEMSTGSEHREGYEAALDLVHAWTSTGDDVHLAPARKAAERIAFGLAREVMALRAANEAWRELACARLACDTATNEDDRHTASKHVSAAVAKLEALGIPYRDTLGEPT